MLAIIRVYTNPPQQQGPCMEKECCLQQVALGHDIPLNAVDENGLELYGRVIRVIDVPTGHDAHTISIAVCDLENPGDFRHLKPGNGPHEWKLQTKEDVHWKKFMV